MPTLRNIGHKISAGHVTVGAMGSVLTIMALPLQTDMKGHFLWKAPNASKSQIPTPARLSPSLAGTLAAEGFYKWRWVFDYMTHDMFSYWRTQFLPSSVFSANVTVLTYDDTDTAIYLQGTIWRPTEGSGLTVQQGGYSDVTFEFTNGVVIT